MNGKMSENPRKESGYLNEISSNLKTYKSCFVPSCTNTTIRAPDKVYLTVPKNTTKHKLWCDGVGIPPEKKLRKSDYCCEDHFDLKSDLENYWRWLLQGAPKKLRENVVPRLASNEAQNSSNNQSFSSQDGNQLQQQNPDCWSSSVSKTPCVASLPLRIDESTQQEIDKENEYVQTVPVKRSSKSIQTLQPKTKKFSNAGVQCELLTCHVTCVSELTDAMEKVTVSEGHDLNETVDSISSNILDTTSSFELSKETKNSNSEEAKIQRTLLREAVYENFTKYLMEDDPLTYIGVCKESMFVVNLLHEASSVSIRDIYLVLKKIRTNLSSKILAHEFSMSESQSSRIFNTKIDVIANYLKQLIFWPSKEDILMNLPIQFRHRFSKVQSIFDTLEIEIEKPSDAVNQALTWSSYKQCNTGKYLISVTPDGIITFISDGACGRCTDLSIAENCGYLDVLPPNTCVLADRGFKGLDVLLHKKQCQLFKPPIVSQGKKSSKKEVQLTKQIASLCIHVERVIKRIRDFQLLDVHTRVDNHLIHHLDSAVKIACASVNLQTPIIKKTEI